MSFYGEAPYCSNWSIYGDTIYGSGTDNSGDRAYCEQPSTTEYIAYEEAQEAGIKKALELILEK